MQTLTDLAVGDRVVLRDVNERHRSRGNPEWEPPIGVVVKIGRTLLHVVPDNRAADYEADPEHMKYLVTKYRLDGGHATGDFGHHNWVRTPEQHADDMARASLLDHLRVAGVRLDGGPDRKLTTRQLGAILAIVRPDEDDET